MKILRIILTIIISVLQLNAIAGNIKTVSISFDRNDFDLSYDENGLLYIQSNTYNVDYGTDFTAPGLPMVPVNVLIPSGYTYKDVTVSQNSSLCLENVLIAQVPIPVPSTIQSNIQVPLPIYDKTEYPELAVRSVGVNNYDGLNVVCFLVSPFEYNSEDKKLFFTDKFNLNINLTPSAAKARSKYNGNDRIVDVVKSIIVNKDDIELYTSQTPSASAESDSEPIDYIVITTSNLKESFMPLISWKRTKGVRSQVITLDYIASNYEGNTMPLKIKACIKALHQNNGLQYVLLGGDDTVVPVQGCYGFVEGSKENYSDTSIPTDLFYACFGGNFNWDADGDGIYGETSDNINLTPSVFITRVPVRNVSHVDAFVRKTLQYETAPVAQGWNNNILMAGNQLANNRDAEAKGELLFSNYIGPYWTGGRKNFYDTETDFSGGASYNLSADNLQNQLSQGYSFVDMITHGSPTTWSMETGDCYSSSYGSALNNKKPMIITTMSCSTNAFDLSNYEPCLSESLIRNANSGVIGYLGCSRYGWFHNDKDGKITLGPSLQYEVQFYKALLTSTIKDKNFGVITTTAKSAMSSKSTSNGANRWIQYGLNPIGDPEMPIFISTPQSFKDVSVILNSSGLSVDVNVPGCRMCVMDSNGGDYYKVITDVSNATFKDVPSNVSICITKQGYIPEIRYLSNHTVYIQNDTLIGNININGDTVKIGSNITAAKPSGKVNICIGKTVIRANTVIIDDGTLISDDANLTICNK